MNHFEGQNSPETVKSFFDFKESRGNASRNRILEQGEKEALENKVILLGKKVEENLELSSDEKLEWVVEFIAKMTQEEIDYEFKKYSDNITPSGIFDSKYQRELLGGDEQKIFEEIVSRFEAKDLGSRSPKWNAISSDFGRAVMDEIILKRNEDYKNPYAIITSVARKKDDKRESYTGNFSVKIEDENVRFKGGPPLNIDEAALEIASQLNPNSIAE